MRLDQFALELALPLLQSLDVALEMGLLNFNRRKLFAHQTKCVRDLNAGRRRDRELAFAQRTVMAVCLDLEQSDRA